MLKLKKYFKKFHLGSFFRILGNANLLASVGQTLKKNFFLESTNKFILILGQKTEKDQINTRATKFLVFRPDPPYIQYIYIWI